MKQIRIFYSTNAKNRAEYPWGVHDGEKVHQAKRVFIHVMSRTEEYSKVNGIPRFVIYCSGILHWNKDKTIAWVKAHE